ncbi:hypothetical protein QN277_002504 [Acacia crassicarpa]|uniref:Endonuclease/exonuclease/phosphatase domain-containing protein n=1 Tax=Acacia crassicarpa TaxID=499986 RepID=A0AAE1NB10_9FABA|nr:hypothetical protein QN277_002504 [Acacia crassicarpa]
MKLMSWNCQGLGRALTVRNLRDLVMKFHPSIIFLMETKMRSSRAMRLRRRSGFQHDLYVEPLGLSGGLAVWWKENISLTVLFKSKNIIHVEIASTSLKIPKFVTFVYGPLKERDRWIVWDLLRSLVAGEQET